MVSRRPESGGGNGEGPGLSTEALGPDVVHRWKENNRLGIDTLLAAHATLTRSGEARLSSTSDPESGSRLHRGLVTLLAT